MIGNVQKPIYNNLFTRSFGGTTEPAVADPFISGYGFFYFDKLPDNLQNYVGTMSNKEIQKALSALCIRVTLPTVTLNKTTINGLGGKKWSYPTNIDVSEQATLAFVEVSGAIIKNIISGWVNMIRDIRTGASQLQGPEYTKTKYSATGYYITTKPDGKTIETADLLTGMFPQKDPFDSFNLDIATNDKVEIDVDFNVDNIWRGSDNGPATGQSFVSGMASTIIETIGQARDEFLHWSGQ